MLKEELSHVFKNINRNELRKFGLTVGIVLILISVFLFYKTKVSAPYILAVGAILSLAGIILPPLLEPLYKVWMGFAVIMGYIMSRVILSLMFFLIFTPVGLILKLLRKDLLKEKIDVGAASYWIKREIKPYDPKRAENQY